MHDPHNTTYVLTGAKIVVSADKILPIGMMVVKNGIIEKVGLVEIPPRDAVKIDLKGYTIYPSFIESYGSFGVSSVKKKQYNPRPQLKTLKEGPFYWNEAIQPEINAYEHYQDKNFKEKQTLLKIGFGAVSTHRADGIMRGTAAFMTMSSHPTVENVIKTEVANHLSFSKGSSRQSYPSSQMGAIALIRQFIYDAKWYAQLKEKTKLLR